MMELTRDGEDVVLRIRAEELLKLAAEPERPAPKYGTGSCFVLNNDPTRIAELTNGAFWSLFDPGSPCWSYPCTLYGLGEPLTTTITEHSLDVSYLPCPPLPPEHPTHEPTGEARVPADDDWWFGIEGNCVFRGGRERLNAQKGLFAGIRHIARLKEPVGIAWLNARIKPDMVFAFRGERYVTGTYLGNPYQICVTPIDRPCHFAVRDRQTDEWRSAAACFRGEVARLSAATVEVIDLGEAPR